MKLTLLTCIMLLGISFISLAQEQEEVIVKGVVTDINQQPLIGVSVSISNTPGLGSITDIDGKYSVKVRPYQTLVYTYLGFDKQEVLVKDQRVINVALDVVSSNATVL